MEYTVKEAAEQILHLHLCEQEGISSGMPTKEQWLKAVEDLEKALVRVPSSPVMGFEEFVNKNYPHLKNTEYEFIKTTLESEYKGYLIGTRSIVPEISDDKIKDFVYEVYTRISSVGWGDKIVSDYVKEFLRSQINK